MIYVILILAVIGGAAFLLMKSGKIEDKNGNNIPDKLEPMVEEVKEVVKKEIVKKEEKPENMKIDDLRKLVNDKSLASKENVKKMKKPELLQLLFEKK